MRAQLLALMLSFVATAALGQVATSSTPGTTAGQSVTGSTAGQNLRTTIAPAPVVTTPPINPAPGTTPTLLTNIPSKPLPRRRTHTVMGTSNTFENGINGNVSTNAVANGTTSAPGTSTASPSQGATNGTVGTQGTTANRTPPAPPNG